MSQHLAWILSDTDPASSKVASTLIDVWLLSTNLAEMLAQIPDLAAGVSADEASVIERLGALAGRDLDLARILAELATSVGLPFADAVIQMPWLDDGVSAHEHRVVDTLYALASHDPTLARITLDLSWVNDGVSEDESWEVTRLLVFSDRDFEFAQEIAQLSWFADGVSAQESGSLGDLAILDEKDPELARRIVGFEWFVDNLSERESGTVWTVLELHKRDPAFARAITELTWLVDGLSIDESWRIVELESLHKTAPELARKVIELSWVADGLTENEVHVMNDVRQLAEHDRKLTQSVIEFPWLSDDVSEYERWVVFDLLGLAKIDVPFAQEVADFPWLSNTVSEIGRWAISNLFWVAKADIDLARSTVDTPLIADADELTRVGADIIRLTLHPDRRAQGLEDDLKKSPWYVDGVNEAEEMLLTTLGGVRASHRLLYEALLESYDLRTRIIQLPLAGEIRLWAFDPLTFREGENPLRDVEDVVRVTEAFMKEPFPASDIVVITSYDKRYGGGAWHAGHYIFIARWGQIHLNKKTVYHEIGHYYFGGGIGPGWLVEGGATYVEAIVQLERRYETLEERRRHVLRYMERECRAYGLRNIQQLNAIQHRNKTYGGICNYHMGEHFLIMLTLTIGVEPVSAALRDVYVQSRTGGRPVTEEEIYRAFLKHTPPELESAFQEQYKRLHGGSFD